MISQIKRLSIPPASRIVYPVYIRTANNRYFIKIKSATEAFWLEYVDSEKFKVRSTGFDICGADEYFDVEFLINFCHSSSEKEYITRLKEFTSHFEFVKTSLKL